MKACVLWSHCLPNNHKWLHPYWSQCLLSNPNYIYGYHIHKCSYCSYCIYTNWFCMYPFYFIYCPTFSCTVLQLMHPLMLLLFSGHCYAILQLLLFSICLSITMYYIPLPQIKGSIKKERVLLANNPFVLLHFQQTITKWFVITYTLDAGVAASTLFYVSNVSDAWHSGKWQLVWQMVVVADGWKVWVVAVAGRSYSRVVFTLAAGKGAISSSSLL